LDGVCVCSRSDHEAPLASVIVADNALLSTGLLYCIGMSGVRAVEVKPITDPTLGRSRSFCIYR
jgi:hypothetical protein